MDAPADPAVAFESFHLDTERSRMRLSHQIAGFAMVPLALFLGYEALKLSYYTPGGPGPGFFPLWLCVLLAVLGLAMAFQARLVPAATESGFAIDRGGLLRITVSLMALFGTVALMGVLGYRLTTAMFYVVLLLAFGRRNVVEIAVLTAVGSLGVHFVFNSLLGQPLPTGMFGW
jgi:putative tricarboxylic transport membrane protein